MLHHRDPLTAALREGEQRPVDRAGREPVCLGTHWRAARGDFAGGDGIAPSNQSTGAALCIQRGIFPEEVLAYPEGIVEPI